MLWNGYFRLKKRSNFVCSPLNNYLALFVQRFLLSSSSKVESLATFSSFEERLASKWTDGPIRLCREDNFHARIYPFISQRRRKRKKNESIPPRASSIIIRFLRWDLKS